MPTQPSMNARETRPAPAPIVAAPRPGAPLQPMIARQPRTTRAGAAPLGRYALPRPMGRRFWASDMAAALFAVLLLLAPLAMAAWHAHRMKGGA
jgi:hypothetical protein